jgi:hypothetical protein
MNNNITGIDYLNNNTESPEIFTPKSGEPRDSDDYRKFSAELLSCNSNYGVRAFMLYRMRCRITSAPLYYALLRLVWDSESSPIVRAKLIDFDFFPRNFEHSHQFLMVPEERRTLQELPKELVIYRVSDRDNPGYWWTIDKPVDEVSIRQSWERSKCERTLLIGRVLKSKILAYFDNTYAREIIVPSERVRVTHVQMGERTTFVARRAPKRRKIRGRRRLVRSRRSDQPAVRKGQRYRNSGSRI